MNRHKKFLILMVATAALAGCKRTPAPATQTNLTVTSTAGDKAIETEIVTTAPISGVTRATAENNAASTKATLIAARRHLLILGLNDAAIDALGTKPGLAATFSLNSPIDGTVVERDATIGATVGTDANVFKIIDTSRVWIDANVFEKDLPRVRNGQGVKVTTTAFPGTTFAGRVIFINSVVDHDSRTIKVRTEVPNLDGRLKPDMFANVEIVTDVNSEAISVPQPAVLEDSGKSIVFVAEGNSYKQRQVQLGIKNGDRVEIIDGLNAGDR